MPLKKTQKKVRRIKKNAYLCISFNKRMIVLQI